jgi:hypothetical protein
MSRTVVGIAAALLMILSLGVFALNYHYPCGEDALHYSPYMTLLLRLLGRNGSLALFFTTAVGFFSMRNWRDFLGSTSGTIGLLWFLLLLYAVVVAGEGPFINRLTLPTQFSPGEHWAGFYLVVVAPLILIFDGLRFTLFTRRRPVAVTTAEPVVYRGGPSPPE